MLLRTPSASQACRESRVVSFVNTLLKALALEHFDDGVRFNAVILLDEADQLKMADIEDLLRNEHNYENSKMLQELLTQ